MVAYSFYFIFSKKKGKKGRQANIGLGKYKLQPIETAYGQIIK
jgi:hypothetical protein